MCSLDVGAPAPVYKLLCLLGRGPSISQTQFLQVCCTMDLHAFGHYSATIASRVVVSYVLPLLEMLQNSFVQHVVKGSCQ